MTPTSTQRHWSPRSRRLPNRRGCGFCCCCSAGELNVKDLTEILGQSQPRISRHLKLLSEAGLVERFRDGSWVYFHVSDRTEGGRLTLRLLDAADASDPVVVRDRERAETLKRDRESVAQDYFRKHASEWDRLRVLHVAESDVEAAMLHALGPGRFKLLVDVGHGYGANSRAAGRSLRSRSRLRRQPVDAWR